MIKIFKVMISLTEWKKKLSHKDQDKISYIQMNQINKQKFLTLAFQTKVIIEKTIGIDWWPGNKNMANNNQTDPNKVIITK